MVKQVKVATLNGIETLEVEERDKPIVLVGRPLRRELRNDNTMISRLFKELGYEVLTAYEYWPRDKYIRFDGTYIPTSAINAWGFKVIGRDGFYVHGGNFLLASKLVAEGIGEGSVREFLQRILGNVSVYFLPEFELEEPIFWHQYEPTKSLVDLDLFISSIPEKNLLFVDEEYYRQHRDLLGKIGEKEGQEIIPTPHSEIRVFPNNVVLLENYGQEPAVVMNSTAQQTIGVYKENGVRVEAPKQPIEYLPDFEGGIRCVTNYVDDVSLLPSLGIQLLETPSHPARQEIRYTQLRLRV